MEPFPSPTLSKRSALVVDPTGEIAEALQPELKARGYHPLISPSATEALRLLAAIEFDLVLCDLQDAGLSRDTFEALVARAQPALAGRCLFIDPRALSALALI